MVVNFNIPIQVEITDNDVSKYAEIQEKIVKEIDEDVNDNVERIADMISESFFKNDIDIETVEVNGKGFYY